MAAPAHTPTCIKIMCLPRTQEQIAHLQGVRSSRASGFPRVTPDIISGRRGLKTYFAPRKLPTSFVIIETDDDRAWKKIRIPAQVTEPFPCKYTFCELPENERQIQRRKQQVQCSIVSSVRNPMLLLLPQHGYDYHDYYYYYLLPPASATNRASCWQSVSAPTGSFIFLHCIVGRLRPLTIALLLLACFQNLSALYSRSIVS